MLNPVGAKKFQASLPLEHADENEQISLWKSYKKHR